MLALAIAPIEAQNLLNLLDVSSFPNMKRDAQSKLIKDLQKISNSYQGNKNIVTLTTKQFADHLR